METSGFRPEHHHHNQSHVPQQSRRDKLRVQQVLNSTPISHHHHHLDNLSINALDYQFTLHHQDHARNIARHSNAFIYDQHGAIVPSEILDFSRNVSVAASSELPQSFMINWSRSLNANAAAQGFDWAAPMSFSGGNSLALGNGGGEGAGADDVAASFKARSGYIAGSSHHHQLNFHNNDDNDNSVLEDQVVTVASTRDVIRSESELALLPFSFSNIGNHHQINTWTDQLGNGNFDSNSDVKSKRDEDHHNSLRTTLVNDSNLQGLSLSLSSINPQPTLPNAAPSPEPKPAAKTGHDHGVGSIPKPSIIGKTCGKSLQDIVGVSQSAYRSTTGPLGPFTGYATILKSSRFLKPAQQLLEELCGSKLMSKSSTTSTSCDVNSERLSGEASATISASARDHDHVDAMDQSSTHSHQVMANIKGNRNYSSNNNNNNSCASSSTFYGSNEINSSDHGGVVSNVSFESGSSRPEQAQQKKAKLLYMQEEVSKRYKQYRQQMQMVVSSFESVAGLSSATPYISLALKAVARHFRCLRNAISDQLSHTRKALGEDFSPPTTGTSSSKGIGAVRLKYNMDQQICFQKHNNDYKAGGATMAFSEPQQHHIWRPQRGLPERSVAVLRAWLFEHFLHPYPTDTDKHMLATQTGLTRNQVSNWFINARVRVWKPMVEEIHTLEMKGSSTEQGNSKHNDMGEIPATTNDHNQASSTKLGSSNMFLNSKQMEFPGMGNYSSAGQGRAELFGGADQHVQSQEKRSRLEYCPQQAPAGSVVQGFVPYHRTGLEVWSRAE